MTRFLAASVWIDWPAASVRKQAEALAQGCSDERSVAAACFRFVRDEIEHSWDGRRNPVTGSASEALHHKTGYCYAKSHLLAALLRANGIPAALCYQRLTFADGKPPFCLHAVYLEPHGWVRLDARGNKPGVDAEFDPPRERLAFELRYEGEFDLPERYADPLPAVAAALRRHTDVRALAADLPDLAAPPHSLAQDVL